MNVCVIIPAAGRSTRFGEQDKLNQDLGGRPLLVRTVELFTKRDEVRSIIVAGPPDEIEEFKMKYGPTLGFHGVKIISGGRVDRWESVKLAMNAVPEDCTHIVVHDAARPGTNARLLNRVFEAAQDFPAVIPGIPIAGTIKRVSDDVKQISGNEDDALADSILGDAGRIQVDVYRVGETIDRTGMMEVQTPQIFAADLLRKAYEQDDLINATDDASLVERLGEPVYVVDGDVRNFKITSPADLKLMRAVLGVRPPAERPVHKRF